MTTWLLLAGIFLGLCFSGIFSGSETGLYSVSKPRIDLEAENGLRGAWLVRRLIRGRSALLITILVGNNLSLELMTLSAEELLAGYDLSLVQHELVLMLLLSPTVFLFGELLPKDLFRRRPHILMRWSAPVLAACRVLFWPLAVVLGLFSRALEQFAGLRPAELAERPRRDEVLSVLAEGRAVGALEPHAEELAHNALKLRSLPVTRAMIPWNEVYALDADLPNEDLGQRVRASAFTRLPVVRRGQVEGYVHQLAVLADGGSRPILEHSEAILCIAPELSVDRALSRLRHAGRRMAVVGQPEAPLGLVTLKDLLEEISGDLGGW